MRRVQHCACEPVPLILVLGSDNCSMLDILSLELTAKIEIWERFKKEMYAKIMVNYCFHWKRIAKQEANCKLKLVSIYYLQRAAFTICSISKEITASLNAHPKFSIQLLAQRFTSPSLGGTSRSSRMAFTVGLVKLLLFCSDSSG